MRAISRPFSIADFRLQIKNEKPRGRAPGIAAFDGESAYSPAGGSVWRMRTPCAAAMAIGGVQKRDIVRSKAADMDSLCPAAVVVKSVDRHRRGDLDPVLVFAERLPLQ